METLARHDIIERLRPLQPHKVILLGSHAWGRPDPDSDIDLLVVLDDDMMAGKASSRGALYKRVARQLRDIERTVPLDLIVHSRSMHQAFLETDSMFARKMKREGEVLYESGN
jgi:predicted nucleotidyltransferase